MHVRACVCVRAHAHVWLWCVWGAQPSWSPGAGENPEGQRESEETSSFEHVCDWQVYGLGKVRGILHNQVIFKNNLPA